MAAASCSATEPWPAPNQAGARQPAIGIKGIVEGGHAPFLFVAPFRGAEINQGQNRLFQRFHRPAAAARPGDQKTCTFYAAFSVSLASVGRPSSIGSDGSRDHSFHDPKYIRTSFTPAFLSARKVLDARAPLKQ